MTRFIALNVAHQTIPRPLAGGLVRLLAEQKPDCMIFNEYVDARHGADNRNVLADHGFSHFAVSEVVHYRPGRWHNQILVAARKPVTHAYVPGDGPNDLSRSNNLRFTYDGMIVTGLRVPTFKPSDWYPYWVWLTRYLAGDLAIGDFNADPRRQRKRDAVLDTLIRSGGWFLARSTSDASFFGKRKGITSLVDHAIVKSTLRVNEIAHLTRVVEEGHTDHAAVMIDVSPAAENSRVELAQK